MNIFLECVCVNLEITLKQNIMITLRLNSQLKSGVH